MEHQPAPPLPRVVAAATHVHRYGRMAQADHVRRPATRRTSCSTTVTATVSSTMSTRTSGTGTRSFVQQPGWRVDHVGREQPRIRGPRRTGTRMALHVGPANLAALAGGDRPVQRPVFLVGQRPRRTRAGIVCDHHRLLFAAATQPAFATIRAAVRIEEVPYPTPLQETVTSSSSWESSRR